MNTPYSQEHIYPIGVVARMLKISVHTIRLYERSGLIIIKRNASGRRVFSEWDIERLRCIRRMIVHEKMNIEGIRRVLSMIPCWLMFEECKASIYQTCPAYTTSSGPCWSLENRPALCAEKDCYQCPVYREPLYCDQIKNSLKLYLKEKK